MCLYRVSRTWKAELDTLRMEQTAQFVDFTEFLRQFDRVRNCPGNEDERGDTKSSSHSWLKPDRDLKSRCVKLARKVLSVCYSCSGDAVGSDGMVIVKLDDEFNRDSYIAGRKRDTFATSIAVHLFGSSLAYWRSTKHVVFVDSVIPEACLRVCSWECHRCRTIRLIRTTVHADRVCRHLIQPLYVASHLALVNQHRMGTVWAQLLDTYGQLADMEVLSLLKQTMIKRRQERRREFREIVHDWYIK